jgi:hypothetical protein
MWTNAQNVVARLINVRLLEYAVLDRTVLGDTQTTLHAVYTRKCIPAKFQTVARPEVS